jgi:hypothetical protein
MKEYTFGVVVQLVFDVHAETEDEAREKARRVFFQAGNSDEWAAPRDVDAVCPRIVITDEDAAVKLLDVYDQRGADKHTPDGSRGR